MSATTNPHSVNILLVDDQPGKLLTYGAILGELGETLLTASSATEALECLLRHEIAVVLVDVCMPDFDGYELATMIRQHPRCQRTSIIFVSAVLLNDLDRLRGYECGAVDYVPVPVVPEILRAKVSIFADLYRKTRALEALNAELEGRVAERTAALEASAAALQETDRKKDEFLAMLAHELRNPLAPIRTAVELLRLEELPKQQRVLAREVIHRQVDHLVNLVDDLLDVSRITRGMISLDRKPVAIASVVARAVETARPLIDARRHDLKVDLTEEVILVDGDETRLVQVVGNVLNNAARFTDPGGQIRLIVTRDRSDVLLKISDTGIGIPPEHLHGIFDLFSQVQSPGHGPHSGGLGIGLALVRRLTEMHGGNVGARSAGLGHGTEITVRLPVFAAHPVMESARSTEPHTVAVVARRRILVADDNEDAAESLSLRLQLAGHDVRTVRDGREALDVAQAFNPEIVLLDLGMPTMDGYETARQMRQCTWGREVTLIALTGWARQQDRERTAQAGFDLHLAKPVGEVELFQVLAQSSKGRSARL